MNSKEQGQSSQPIGKELADATDKALEAAWEGDAAPMKRLLDDEDGLIGRFQKETTSEE